MSNLFNTVFVKKPRRNKFNLSHDRKFSTEFGRLTPVMCQEVLPGDKFTITPAMLLRMAPMVAPVMHRMRGYIHYFFVPNRIVWNEWENFITGGEDGTAEPDFPYLDFDRLEPSSLADYLGVSHSNNRRGSDDKIEFGNIRVSAIPFAGFIKIYNEYYRDQNLTDPIPGDSLENGDNSLTLAPLCDTKNAIDQVFKRSWKHDYFTSALPFAQKGTPVSIPIGDTADLVYDNSINNPGENYTKIRDHEGNPWTEPPAGNPVFGEGVRTENYTVGATGDKFSVLDYDRKYAYIDVSGNHYVDLSSATSNTINDLRRAFRLQEWLEKNARGGTRYTEFLQVHFGVKPRDSRLQRPEYIGGINTDIQVSEVLQTSSPQTEDDTPQANMAGHGVAGTPGKGMTKYVEEHGYIIGILSVMPDGAYQQGIPRHFSKFDRFDYYFQEFAHIGEQEIYNREIYADGSAVDDQIFGYTPRYSEYRYQPSTVHGDFLKSLDFWHFGRIFSNRPNLNKTFIDCNPGKRIFSIQDLPEENDSIRSWDTLYCHVYNKVTAIRPLPKFGIPSF